jgi:hypothetical protein
MFSMLGKMLLDDSAKLFSESELELSQGSGEAQAIASRRREVPKILRIRKSGLLKRMRVFGHSLSLFQYLHGSVDPDHIGVLSFLRHLASSRPAALDRVSTI